MAAANQGQWAERIAWEGPQQAGRLRLAGPAYDLNDAGQAFELTRQLPATGGDQALAQLVGRAAALIVQPQTVVSGCGGGAGCHRYRCSGELRIKFISCRRRAARICAQRWRKARHQLLPTSH